MNARPRMYALKIYFAFGLRAAPAKFSLVNIVWNFAAIFTKEKAFSFMLIVHVSYQEPHLINCTTWGWPECV